MALPWWADQCEIRTDPWQCRLCAKTLALRVFLGERYATESAEAAGSRGVNAAAKWLARGRGAMGPLRG